MKATIDFDDALYRRLKIEAARCGRTVRELVAEGVRQVLDARIRSPGIARALLVGAVAQGASQSHPGLLDRLIHAEYARDDLQLVPFDRELARLGGG